MEGYSEVELVGVHKFGAVFRSYRGKLDAHRGRVRPSWPGEGEGYNRTAGAGIPSSTTT
jgi:hypothetical protein